MRNFTSVLILTFAVALGACDNPNLSYTNPQTTICDGDQVDNLILHVTQGAAKVKVTQITYSEDRSFNTSIEFDVTIGDVVKVPFCNKQGIGDVRFQLEVAPSGPGVLYGYEHSVEIYYEVVAEHADIEIWDNTGFGNFGSGYAGIGTHTNGEFDHYWVEIQWWTM